MANEILKDVFDALENNPNRREDLKLYSELLSQLETTVKIKNYV